MAQVAFHGSKTQNSTASGHVPIRKWVPKTCDYYVNGVCGSWSGGYYSYSTASATIKGDIQASVHNVYVNSKKIATVNDTVQETETHNIPSGWSAYSHHYTGQGKVTSGSSRVFANGRAVTSVGKQVRTHANTMTTISNGSSNVHVNN